MLRTLKDIDVNGKKVFVRVDFNVPVKDGMVTDDTRIIASLRTIKYLLDNGAYVTVASHLGRPKGEKNLKYSMKPVAYYIDNKKYFNAKFVDDCIGEPVAKAIAEQKQNEVLVLENLRFYPQEEANDAGFVQELAKPFDVYVNDAFGTCHRKHASVYGMPMIMKVKAAGFLVEKEMAYFTRIATNPEKPFVAVLGGAKVSDKIGVIKSLLYKTDAIIIGGAMSYTFLKHQGHSVGKSLVEDDSLETVGEICEIAKKNGVKVYLPVDHITSTEFNGAPIVCNSVDIPAEQMGLDVGSQTVKEFEKVLSVAKTVLWNGPMGVFENPDYANGTFAIARYLAALNATVVVGGGDSLAAVNAAGAGGSISHLSTGGGASLEYLEHGTLPGIDALLS